MKHRARSQLSAIWWCLNMLKLFQLKVHSVWWLSNAVHLRNGDGFFDISFAFTVEQNRPCRNYWFRIPTNSYVHCHTHIWTTPLPRATASKSIRTYDILCTTLYSADSVCYVSNIRVFFLFMISWYIQIDYLNDTNNS